MKIRVGSLAIVAMMVVGCAQAVGSVTTAPPAVTQAPAPSTAPQATQAPAASEAPSVAPSAAPSVAPSSGIQQQKVGDTVDITCSGADCLDITVDKVQFAKSYRDPQGYLNDTPTTKGDEFLAYHIIYKAIGPNATYSEGDWAVYANSNLVNIETFVEHGPTPTLGVGDLPDGKSVSGWLVQEVPPTGSLVIAYQPDNTELYEIQVRP